MKTYLPLFIILCSLFSLSFKWETFSLSTHKKLAKKIQILWKVDTVQKKGLRSHLVHNSPTLLTENFVIQGNALNGIRAYKKNNGQLVWSFAIQGAVSSPLVLHKKQIYFGSGDGFFYNLDLQTGRLLWKFFTGSENVSTPLIDQDQIYWTANNQKLYSLSLNGELRWIYSGHPLSMDFVVRGRPGPAIYKNLIYVGFFEGSVVALNKMTGKLKWKKNLAPSYPLTQDFMLSGNCLFVPVFDFYLFCLNPLNGAVRWKTKGGGASYLKGNTVMYQFYKQRFFAFKKNNGKLIWQIKLKEDGVPFSPKPFKQYLIYGFPNEGFLTIAHRKNGKTLNKFNFGRGLAAPVTIDEKTGEIYFFSIDGFLHKALIL